MLQKILFQMLFFLTEKTKCVRVSTKIWTSTRVFNTDNNQKCFLSSKSSH